MEEYICKYCGKTCKNSNSLIQHERLCKRNPNHQESSWIKYNQSVKNGKYKNSNQYVKAKCLGIDYKMSDETKQKISKIWKGKHFSDEHKKKISEGRKKILNDHPEMVPFKLNHSSKQSYPERYFQIIFHKENIDLKYHLQVKRYELDFYNKEKKRYIEIDGEQHFVTKYMVNHDIERNEFLKNLGWSGMRIRWSVYKSKSIIERKQIIEDIRKFIES